MGRAGVVADLVPRPPAESDIAPIVLGGVLELALRQKLPVASWFDGIGVDPVALADPATARISFDDTTTVLGRALRSLPPGPVGMWVGCRDVLMSLGPLCLALTACATTAEAIALGSELHLASGSLVDVDFDIDERHITLTIREREPDPALIVFLTEEALCTALVFARTMLGADLAPISVDVPYPAPDHVREYERVFRCAVNFGADLGRLRFPIAILERPFPLRHEATCAAATQACRRLLRPTVPGEDIVADVESLLVGADRLSPSVSQVARRLHLTERTLRRQLHTAGETFTGVRDRVRERRATELLRESTLTVDAIAKEVGFGTGRDLRRAYSRWTGDVPSAVRRRFSAASRSDV